MKKKKATIILLSVFAVLLLLTAGVITWQWQNVKALRLGLKYSSAEINEQKEENEAKIQEAVQSTNVEVRAPSSEEMDALKNGELSQEELIQRLLGKNTDSPDNDVPVPHSETVAADGAEAVSPEGSGEEGQQTAVPTEAPNSDQNSTPVPTELPADPVETPVPVTGTVDPVETPVPVTETLAPLPTEVPSAPVTAPVTPTEAPDVHSGSGASDEPEGKDDPVLPTVPPEETQLSEYEARIGELIAEIYILRAEMNSSVEAVVQEALADYRSNADGTKESKSQFVSKYAGIIEDMEAECDGKMDTIIAEVRQLVEENGGDLTLPDTIYQAYYHEKVLTRASYIARFNEWMG